MLVPLSWLKDFVDIDLPIHELARLLTMLGLEVDSITLVGLPDPYAQAQGPREFKVSGLSWDPEKIVVASILEVMPHPNADRLVLCRLYDGQQEHVVLTGAPNLYPYKSQGPLPAPLKVAYAKEGARIYDGHQPGQVLTTLKRAKIRGIDSYSMVCSEKELGISDEHEGVIILDADAPAGMPLVEYMGDAVFEISILPNMIRNACVTGVAREVAAATGKPLHLPPPHVLAEGPSIAGKVSIDIRNPDLNPRFVVGLIRNAEIRPSPYWVQRRLRLAGMRPISNIVDATNYVMLEVGQPLHAFDYDVLVKRAGGHAPTIITRTAHPGERLTTLDGVDRALDPYTVLVCDTAGALSIAGVMGGEESEISASTRNILLEGAAWNSLNIRKTANSQRLQSEAAYRFSRGIPPALAEWGVIEGLERMRAWSGGVVDQGLVDAYPLPPVVSEVAVTPQDASRLLGIDLTAAEIAALLERLEFTSRVQGETVYAKAPPHRMDIGTGSTGKADVLEEVARVYGYDRIPGTRLADRLPPQMRNRPLEIEERIRDILTGLELQEVVSYRMTSVEREARLLPERAAAASKEYLHIKNPITPERNVLRRSLLASVLDALEKNAHWKERLALFEIGPVFDPAPDSGLPAESPRLAIVMRGPRHLAGWDRSNSEAEIDFYDLKGLIAALLDTLHVPEVIFEPVEDARFHPGKSARVRCGDAELGVFGELHPLVQEHYDVDGGPIQAADLDLAVLIAQAADLWTLAPVPVFPPVLEDIAVVVDEATPAAQVETTIREAGGKMLSDVRLFDIFRGEQIGAGKKSLAYSLTYMSPDRTLMDAEAAQIRQRIVRRLEKDLGARLRS